METFAALLAICAGTPHKGQWRRALMFSLICTWINGWVNNPEAGDLRRHLGHYDVTVMLKSVNEAQTQFLLVNTLRWVFLIFSDSLLIFNDSDIGFKSCLTPCCHLITSLPSTKVWYHLQKRNKIIMNTNIGQLVYIDYKQGGSKNGTPWNIAINSSSLGQNGRHFTDDVFRHIFVNEKFCILINLIRISLKFVFKGPIDNNPSLVQIMYWCRIGAIIWTNADPIHWRIYSVLWGRWVYSLLGRFSSLYVIYWHMSMSQLWNHFKTEPLM